MKKSILIKNNFKRITGILFILFICDFVNAQSRDIPFTLEDRDRIIQIEEKLNSQQKQMESLRSEMITQNNSLRNEMNSKFEAMTSKFETLFWTMGILITLVITLLVYIIWDRRTTLYPILQKTIALEEKFKEVEEIKKWAWR